MFYLFFRRGSRKCWFLVLHIRSNMGACAGCAPSKSAPVFDQIREHTCIRNQSHQHIKKALFIWFINCFAIKPLFYLFIIFILQKGLHINACSWNKNILTDVLFPCHTFYSVPFFLIADHYIWCDSAINCYIIGMTKMTIEGLEPIIAFVTFNACISFGIQMGWLYVWHRNQTSGFFSQCFFFYVSFICLFIFLYYFIILYYFYVIFNACLMWRNTKSVKIKYIL